MENMRYFGCARTDNYTDASCLCLHSGMAALATLLRVNCRLRKVDLRKNCIGLTVCSTMLSRNQRCFTRTDVSCFYSILMEGFRIIDGCVSQQHHV